MLLISACLTGVNCRYDRSSSLIPELQELVDEGRAIAVCPELLGGLKVTRVPCEIQIIEGDRRVIDANGLDNTKAFILGAEKTLELAQKHGIKRAILKSKSPSCGCGEVYDGTFSRVLTKGSGFTAEILKENGIEVFSEKNFIL